MERTIFALFDDAAMATEVGRALDAEGFPRAAINLLLRDGDGPVELNGIGRSTVSGPLSDALNGAKPGGVDLAGSLQALGFPGPEARHFFESVRRGQAIVGVAASPETDRKIVVMLRRLGARGVQDIGGDSGSERRPAVPVSAEPSGEQVRVPIIEEELEIGKRQVARGGVRIDSRVVEEPVSESVLLREERVHVERRPVDRDATDEDIAAFQEGVIEIHETIEEPVIRKRSRVVEEIVIAKEHRQRTETISEKLRKTEVRVEPLRSEQRERAN